MLGIWTNALAQDGGHGTEIFYVIAVLILSGVGALAEKLKQKKQESKRHWKPTKIEGPPRPARRAPPRPAQPAARREPAAPGSAPPTRTVQRKAVVPRPPAPARPHPQVLTERQVQPTIGQRRKTRRPAPGQRRARRPTRKPTPELLAQLEQRAKTARSEALPTEPTLAEQLSPADTRALPGRHGPSLFTPVRSMNQMSIRELRNAIVLSEVLQPPLALRDLQ